MGLLDLSLIPPVIGNLIIIISSVHHFSMAGYYIYFIGMALVMLASVRFAAEYCGIKDDLEKVSPQLKKLFGERPFTNRDCQKLHIAAYDNKLREKALWDQQITADLAEAIATRQIRPYLQPITDRSGKVVGAEALARWIHPQHGFMSPAVFIPLLEKNGLIVEVDKHIWRCACEILADWKKEGKEQFISVNISPKDFYYIDIVSEIKGLVQKYDLSPEKLRIELTETVMMTDAKEKFRMLDELRHAGFIVEMDDFGSGYSSLNLLKDMPVDVLKLDMKFLSDTDGSTRAKTIIRNIIRLSEELNIVSLTEGVETLQQYDQLSSMGCMLFQGYYFAKPMPRDEFENFAATH